MNIGVIGAGVFGLASAIELRARGHVVTLFDQGTVPHEAASSTDVSKGIRRTWYAGDNETYVELVERAAEQWTRWEERSGTTFYHQVGGAYILDGMETGSPMHASVDFLRSRGADISVLAAPEARARFPQFRLADHELCVIDPWTGYIESARAVSFMCRLAGEEGVVVREESPVAGVEERAGRVDIALDGGGRAGFDRAVVAVGVWIGRLLPEIGRHVRVTHQEMLLIEPADPGQFAAGAMPVWSVEPEREGWYGFPVLRGGYAKVAIDPPGDTVDPDLDRSGTPEFRERALAFLERRIPDLARGRIVGGRSCLYAATPDDHFIVDWAPGSSRVLVAGGGSGHGFKFGGGIGPVVADAVEDAHNPLGDRFRIGSRFDEPEHGGTQSDRGYARPADAP
jgi:glycine/D-amino acid oxidase-like deaminating enzyme